MEARVLQLDGEPVPEVPTTPGEEGNTSSQLVNLSTQSKVGTGADVLVGGFVITGDAPKKVFIRASGPSLVAAGIGNALSDPRLTLFSGSAEMASNDDWGSGIQASEISQLLWKPTHAKEPGILVTLQSGAYTARVNGGNGATGIGICNSPMITNKIGRGVVQIE